MQLGGTGAIWFHFPSRVSIRFCLSPRGNVHPTVGFPKDVTEQHLLAQSNSDVYELLGAHGTIVFMPECDRLTYATDRKLVEHCVKRWLESTVASSQMGCAFT